MSIPDVNFVERVKSLIKRLVELQPLLFEAMLFVLFVDGVYDVLDHTLHLTEKITVVAWRISILMG